MMAVNAMAGRGSIGSVFYALIFREAATRFGRVPAAGLLWALLEPMIHVAVWLGLFTQFSRSTMSFEDTVLTIFIGSLGFIYVRQVMQLMAFAVPDNRVLLSYPGVTPGQTVMARLALETLLTFASLAVCALIAGLFGVLPSVSHPLVALAACAGLVLLALVEGLLCAALVLAFSPGRKLVPLIIRGIYIISCTFYSLHVLPPTLAAICLWNPLAHLVEVMRFAILEQPLYPGVSLGGTLLALVISLPVSMALFMTSLRKAQL